MTLAAYGGTPIRPDGICQLTCSMSGYVNTSEINFYVTPVDAHPILGLNDCVQLGLMKHVYHIQEGPLTKESLQEG